MWSARIRDSSVERGIPSLWAEPSGPAARPREAASASPIVLISTRTLGRARSRFVAVMTRTSGGPTPGVNAQHQTEVDEVPYGRSPSSVTRPSGCSASM